MTQHLHEVITEDLLEYNILRSVSEPLSSQDLTQQSLITPLGVQLDEERPQTLNTLDPEISTLLDRQCPQSFQSDTND